MQYKDVDPEKAVQDYWSRIKDHEKHYEPVVETNWPFIRIINVRCLLCFRLLIHLRLTRSAKRSWLMLAIAHYVRLTLDLSIP